MTDGTGYGDEITSNWDLPGYANRESDEVTSNWDLADRPAKDVRAATFREILVGIADIMADRKAARGGPREPAPTPKVAKLRAMSYSDYLKTVAWSLKREEKIAEAGTSCQRCGLKYADLKEQGRTPLNVHHLTYVRLGDERLDDLAVLCRLCHKRQHTDDDPYAGEVA